MAEPNNSPALPDWMKDHIARYIATDGADGYLWDASIGGGKGMVPTLLLTTVGRKSGRVLTLPLISAGPVRTMSWSPPRAGHRHIRPGT